MPKKPFASIPSKTSQLSQRLSTETEIDIWTFKLDAPLPALTHQILGDDELARANRFYFDHHRHQFKRGRAILRQILSHYLDQAPEKIQFGYTDRGKPFINDQTNLTFNLSHSGHHALLAVGRKYAVGIDIEQFSARPYLGMSQEVFSQKEQEKLRHLPSYLQPLMFFNVWAQKEALIKLVGLGLSYPLKSVTVSAFQSSAYPLHCPVTQTEYVLHPFMISSLLSCAICHHPSIDTIYMEHYETIF